MTREYGAAGLVGLLPPQSNATVEAEMAVLLEPDVATIVSRLVCAEPDSKSRLLGYFGRVHQSVAAFDQLVPGVILYACTGSAYLVGANAEAQAFAGTNIISAAHAIRAALDAVAARRIALVSPYPPWLTEACVSFWRREGRVVTEVLGLEGDREDTRRIYGLRSGDALRALARLDASSTDAVLITGTGMPSLGALARARLAVPLLSSNLCLAWAASQRLRDAPFDCESLLPWLSGNAAWHRRFAARFPRAPGDLQ